MTANDDVRANLSERWERDGHDVFICEDDAGGSCRSIRSPGDCPLHSDLDLTVLVSHDSSPSDLVEMGYVCAQRHRVPTVAIDPVRAADELWSIEPEMTLARRQVEADDASAVSRALPEAAAVTVHRTRRHVTVDVEADAAADSKHRLWLADRARAAMRQHDPYVSVIDVIVTATPIDTEEK